jgi:1-acyl-sn-glycerol-3-phosphate acyltransferase
MVMDDRLGYWRRHFGLEWPGQEICAALAAKYLERVEVVDPKSLVALAGKPMLFLANHQCFVESLLFSYAVPPLCGRPVVALAKMAHRDGWLGRFVDLVFGYPGVPEHHAVEYIDRDDPDVGTTVARLEAQVRGGHSLLIHVEGTRRRSARRGRVLAVSPLWIGLAMAHDWPIVPVRFVGGLPIEDLGYKLDAPYRHGRQIIRLGRPISCDELLRQPVDGRVSYVRAAINALQDCRTEEPGAPDHDFGIAVDRWTALTGAEPMAAVLLEGLRRWWSGGGCRARSRSRPATSPTPATPWWPPPICTARRRPCCVCRLDRRARGWRGWPRSSSGRAARRSSTGPLRGRASVSLAAPNLATRHALQG